MASAAPSVGSVPEQSSSNSAKASVVSFFKDFYDIGHVGREGTETLLNTLLIAYIRKDILKDGEL